MEEMLSSLGGKATQYIFKKKPSRYIPFKGDFPLAKEWQHQQITDAIHNHRYLSEIKEVNVQEIISKGAKMYDLENSFTDFLQKIGQLDGFLKLPADKKADLLVRWMDANCVTTQYLNI